MSSFLDTPLKWIQEERSELSQSFISSCASLLDTQKPTSSSQRIRTKLRSHLRQSYKCVRKLESGFNEIANGFYDLKHNVQKEQHAKERLESKFEDVYLNNIQVLHSLRHNDESSTKQLYENLINTVGKELFDYFDAKEVSYFNG